MYDAGVIDLGRSSLGIYAARELRNHKITTPIVGITRGSEDHAWGDYRAMFLENGGDDLLRGPVNPRELVATLRAITRRNAGVTLDILEYQSGDAHMKLNLTAQSIIVNGKSLALTGKEFLLVSLLAATPGRVFSKEMLLLQMYVEGVDEEPEMKIIDVFICKLRKKLKEVHEDAGNFIETVWGPGTGF